MDYNAALVLKRIMERHLLPKNKQKALCDMFPKLMLILRHEGQGNLLESLEDEGYIAIDPDDIRRYIPTPLADRAEEQGLLDAVPPAQL